MGSHDIARSSDTDIKHPVDLLANSISHFIFTIYNTHALQGSANLISYKTYGTHIAYL